ncbi:autotransporter family protein [Cupriavidus campinensis]
MPSSWVIAQVAVPDSSSTVLLQSLDPIATDFFVGSSTVVTTASGDGVTGDNSRDWTLSNFGAITGAANGVFLQSANNAARFENNGSVTSLGTGPGGIQAGVNLEGGGTIINHDGATIKGSMYGVYASSAGVTVQNDGLIQAPSGTGVFLQQGGTFTQGSAGRVTGSFGVVFSGGIVAGSNSGVIVVLGNALWVQNHATGAFDNTGGFIATRGTVGDRVAVFASNGGSIDLHGGTIIASQVVGGAGISATGTDSRVSASDLELSVSGLQSHGASAQAGGTVELSNVEVGTNDSASRGVQAGPGGTVRVRGVGLQTLGLEWADGVLAAGDSGAGAGGVVEVQDTAILTIGQDSHGARAVGAGTGTPASLTISDSLVVTSGPSATGLIAIAGTTLTASNVDVITQGDFSDGATARSGARLVISGGSVTTTGDDSPGLSTVGAGPADPAAELVDPVYPLVAGPSVAGASLVATGVAVNTSGVGSHALRVRGDSSLTMIGGTATATGANANAVQYEEAGTGTVDVSNATLASQQGLGIGVTGGTLNATLTATSLTGATALFNVTGGGTLNLTAASGTTLTGAALTEAGSTSNLVLNDSTWHLTGDSRVTTLVNDPSQILFSAPVDGAFKTLTVSQYSGDGTIGLNTRLDGDGSPSDRLVIDGGTATGASKLRVTNAGGNGALTSANGILVVDAVNGGTTQAGAFALDGRAVAGPYEYLLYRGSKDATAPNAWYLRSEIPEPPPAPPAPTPDVRPLYRPEVAAYLANQRLSGQMFVHSLHDRRGEPQAGEGQAAERQGQTRAGWLRVVGKWEGSRSQDGVFKTSTDAVLLQGGAEVGVWQAGGPASRLHGGVMGSYGNASTDADAQGNAARAKGKVEGWSLGIYGTWYQDDETKQGAYADTWFQYGWFSNRVEGDHLPTVKYDANGFAASGEVGYAVPLRGGWVVEPQAQLIYVNYNEDDIDEPNGTRVRGASSRGVLTRLGVRTHRTFQRDDGRKLQPYATINWWYADTDSDIAFNQVPIGSMYPRNRFEVKVGMNVALDKAWSGWANVSGAWGQQDYYQYALRVGVRYAW